MRKEEIWCDNSPCGRLIQVKNVPAHSADISNVDESWEVWTPGHSNDVDRVYCSLECLVNDMSELLHTRTKNENS